MATISATPKGKLIILEAGDASGKATQTRLLTERLEHEGRDVRRVAFPDYESESSALVKMYLSGKFGGSADDVNPYAASTFFAVDRFASFRLKWRAFYEKGGIVIADRYTTSNLVHQAVKLDSAIERAQYREWLLDFEYVKLGLPRPDCVVFLDMASEVSDRLLELRKERGEDIHEMDKAYLHKCHAMYQEVAALYAWERVVCSSGGKPRRVAAIADDVYKAVIKYL